MTFSVYSYKVDAKIVRDNSIQNEGTELKYFFREAEWENSYIERKNGSFATESEQFGRQTQETVIHDEM